jgi:SSS family solute:Na+ symporter
VTISFALVILLSLLIALASGRGHRHQRAEDFFVASGQFGTLLFFFLSVGETYSVGTVLGFPGGVVAHGTGFVSWFLGYILLSFPVGYFLYPLIWRAGRLHGAVTLPDLFRGHFRSRRLELVVTLASIAFLVPLGVMQFVGLNTVFAGIGWGVPPPLLAGLGGALAFTYIAISGIRAPAYVSVLKDALVMAAILITGLACLAAPTGTAPPSAAPVAAATGRADIFAVSTIILQAIGFCVVPQTCAAVFTARSAATVRRAQVAMPLYMVMFPFLIACAYFAMRHGLKLTSPNDVFLATARALLPGWAVGLVMAGAALSALVVLTGICLALGSLVTRNLVPGLSGDQQQFWAKLVIAAYLLLSMAGAARTAQLMIAFNNLFYFGVTQAFPGVLAIVSRRACRPGMIAAGLAAGDAIAIFLHEAAIPLGGCNPGLIGLVVNLAIVFAAAPAWRRRADRRAMMAG